MLLIIKTVHQLEGQSRVSTKGTEAVNSGRLSKRIELTEAIRYSSRDPIESWLHNLLCLDVTNSIPAINRSRLKGKFLVVLPLEVLSAGHQPSGNQIPWKFCEQFRDENFPSLSGARIVRIATHPNAMKLGYGSTAVELLTRYFEGQFAPISEADDGISSDSSPVRITDAAEKNAVTGEHTCIVLKPLDIENIEANFRASFAKRLCSPRFNTMDYKLSMSLLDPKLNLAEAELPTSISYGIYSYVAKRHSRKRLEAYVDRLVEHYLISDLKLSLADLYFLEMLPVSLSLVQASVLLCMDLQNQYLSYTEVDLKPHPITLDKELDAAAKQVKVH